MHKYSPMSGSKTKSQIPMGLRPTSSTEYPDAYLTQIPDSAFNPVVALFVAHVFDCPY